MFGLNYYCKCWQCLSLLEWQTEIIFDWIPLCFVLLTKLHFTFTKILNAGLIALVEYFQIATLVVLVSFTFSERYYFVLFFLNTSLHKISSLPKNYTLSSYMRYKCSQCCYWMRQVSSYSATMWCFTCIFRNIHTDTPNHTQHTHTN